MACGNVTPYLEDMVIIPGLGPTVRSSRLPLKLKHRQIERNCQYCAVTYALRYSVDMCFVLREYEVADCVGKLRRLQPRCLQLPAHELDEDAARVCFDHRPRLVDILTK